MTGRPRNTDEKFWQKVEWSQPDDCWNWKGSTKNGYGRFTQAWVEHYAHRRAWELNAGTEVPDGMMVMHSCNNKTCCNPKHLSLGTAAKNTQDAYRDGLVQILEGEKHPRSLLNATDVLAIHADSRTYSEIARSFGIALTTVSSIKNGYTWSHLTGGRYERR